MARCCGPGVRETDITPAPPVAFAGDGSSGTEAASAVAPLPDTMWETVAGVGALSSTGFLALSLALACCVARL